MLVDSKINELKSYVEENFSKKRKTTKQLNPSNPLANPKTLNTNFGVSKIKEPSIDDMFK